MNTGPQPASDSSVGRTLPPRTSPTWFGAVLRNIRQQVVAGLLLVLPTVATLWIVTWIYRILEDYLIEPIGRFVVNLIEGRTNGVDLPVWFTSVVAPLIGIIGVVALLYCLGVIARLRLAGWIDQLLLRVPFVQVIHNAVIKILEYVGGQGELTKFKRVVLVAFPHPGMRVPGFVTSSCQDASTQKTILCIYVPTTPVPTSGYMLLVPEEEVTELDWNLEQTVQAVVSFGLTAPKQVSYFRQLDDKLASK